MNDFCEKDNWIVTTEWLQKESRLNESNTGEGRVCVLCSRAKRALRVCTATRVTRVSASTRWPGTSSLDWRTTTSRVPSKYTSSDVAALPLSTPRGTAQTRQYHTRPVFFSRVKLCGHAGADLEFCKGVRERGGGYKSVPESLITENPRTKLKLVS